MIRIWLQQHLHAWLESAYWLGVKDGVLATLVVVALLAIFLRNRHG